MSKKLLGVLLTVFIITGCSADNTTETQPRPSGKDYVLTLVECNDAYITRGFGGYEGHEGVDIAAPEGSYIYAADSGVVIQAVKMNLGYGIYCVIQHDGYQTLYAHCSALTVQKGDIVEKGKVIGAVGNTGNSTGPHLHLEVISDGQRQDPEQWYK